MSINGINAYSSSLNLSDILTAQTNSATTSGINSSSSFDINSIGLADSASFSASTKIYARLQELVNTDPKKFKEVCSKVAMKLNSISQEQGGSQAKMLSRLADKFQNVAEGGDISQLKPQDPPSYSNIIKNPIDAYIQQQNKTLVEIMNAQDNKKTDDNMNQILSLIMNEIDNASTLSVTL